MWSQIDQTTIETEGECSVLSYWPSYNYKWNCQQQQKLYIIYYYIISFKTRDIMVPFFKTLIRPDLKYGIVWCPNHKKHVLLLESVQSHFTKRIIGKILIMKTGYGVSTCLALNFGGQKGTWLPTQSFYTDAHPHSDLSVKKVWKHRSRLATTRLKAF